VAAFSGATKVTYSWQANGTAITGAASFFYRIPNSLLHKTLTCSVTASNAKGSVSGTSKGAAVSGGRRYPFPWSQHSQGSGRKAAGSASPGSGQKDAMSLGSGRKEAVSPHSGPSWASDALSALRDLTGFGL
jgi:hypothetical protein